MSGPKRKAPAPRAQPHQRLASPEEKQRADAKLRESLEKSDKVDPDTRESDPLRDERRWEPDDDAPFEAG